MPESNNYNMRQDVLTAIVETLASLGYTPTQIEDALKRAFEKD